ncbi:hypothetical protein PVAP13_1NG278000 [Panicum virgatum]|uniref:Uncharacterized protein n=1 Tax=Panicum virgatum TaxID=38727 RepID=A0A8T0X1U6_PANVG|nr:hypothetical protein PVAP13_1NG278000 [Panicum virgatum]
MGVNPMRLPFSSARKGARTLSSSPSAAAWPREGGEPEEPRERGVARVRDSCWGCWWLGPSRKERRRPRSICNLQGARISPAPEFVDARRDGIIRSVPGAERRYAAGRAHVAAWGGYVVALSLNCALAANARVARWWRLRLWSAPTRVRLP